MSQAPKILVVDDSSAMRSLISHHLSKEGYVVNCVENGVEAIRQGLSSHPDLIIMDLELNGESGLDLIKTFQKLPAFIEIPILACSGNTDESIRQHALNAGAKSYLVKNETLRSEILSGVKSYLTPSCSAR